MPCAPQPQPAAAVVAQRLSDLLLSFPAAAIGGVQWQVLVHKYEERYSTHLDLEKLGHASPLVAATALLWDVLRLVDKEDTDNPIVAVEDAVALTPRPGLLGSWPSLYTVLCEIVISEGHPAASDKACKAEDGARCLLLSQLRPLMERRWHASFDESALGFLNEDGSYFKLKKLKHLLHAVLRWREQRRQWQRRASAYSAVDEAVAYELRMVPSSKHNDLLLVCTQPAGSRVPSLRLASEPAPTALPAGRGVEELAHAFDVEALQREVARLRGENTELRLRNVLLQQQGAPDAGGRSPRDLLDDPFEPPPEASRPWQRACAPEPMPLHMSKTVSFDFVSTDNGSEASYAYVSEASSCTSCSSPSSRANSGAATPACERHSGFATAGITAMAPQGCAFMPVWFPIVQTQMPWSVIPQGIVKTACEHFERVSAGTGLM